MTDDLIIPNSKILSLDEARKAADGRSGEERKEVDPLSPTALKRPASREFVITEAAKIAIGAGAKVYDMIGVQQGEQLEKLEYMIVQQLREEMYLYVDQRLLEQTWRWRIKAFLGRCLEPFAPWNWPSVPAPAVTAEASGSSVERDSNGSYFGIPAPLSAHEDYVPAPTPSPEAPVAE